MYRTIPLSVITLIFILFEGCSPKDASDLQLKDRYRSFNQGWKFKLDSVNNFEMPDFTDSEWQTVDLPHDWSIERQPEIEDQYTIGIFSKQSPGGASTGYMLGGIGWYRKSFFIDQVDSNKIFNLYFDGVYMLSDVFVNGRLVGSHFNGYTPFSYNITDYILPGEENVVAVKVKNLGENSRWYSGSGIYRDVTLVVTGSVYFSENDIFVTTTEVSEEKAAVNVAMVVRNESKENQNVKISTKIIDPAGEVIQEKELQQELGTGPNKTGEAVFSITNPKLWSPGTPELYSLKVAVSSGNQVMDEYLVQKHFTGQKNEKLKF